LNTGDHEGVAAPAELTAELSPKVIEMLRTDSAAKRSSFLIGIEVMPGA
jgi:hypothetical protein